MLLSLISIIVTVWITAIPYYYRRYTKRSLRDARPWAKHPPLDYAIVWPITELVALSIKSTDDF